ncbi:MAG: response regulator transcription factor [Thermodesulfobacteria bacterium]|nr:response regulator transcription factor [Thermodesulfobacteriota bacterium]
MEYSILVKIYNNFLKEAVINLLIKEGIKVFDSEDNFSDLDFILVDHKSLDMKLFSRYPKAKIIFLDTGVREKELLKIFKMYKIAGIIAPYTDVHLFKKALQVIENGQIWLDNYYTKILINNYGEGSIARIQENTLTERERQIIERICRGMSNKEIAYELNISIQTVKTHIYKIFQKLNVSSRAQLISLFLDKE